MRHWKSFGDIYVHVTGDTTSLISMKINTTGQTDIISIQDRSLIIDGLNTLKPISLLILYTKFFFTNSPQKTRVKKASEVHFIRHIY